MVWEYVDNVFCLISRRKAQRTVEITSEAAWIILYRDSKSCSGNFFIDEAVLKEEGVTDFTKNAVDLEKELFVYLFCRDTSSLFSEDCVLRAIRLKLQSYYSEVANFRERD